MQPVSLFGDLKSCIGNMLRFDLICPLSVKSQIGPISLTHMPIVRPLWSVSAAGDLFGHCSLVPGDPVSA